MGPYTVFQSPTKTAAELLLAKDAAPLQQLDSIGRTPLHWAAAKGLVGGWDCHAC